MVNFFYLDKNPSKCAKYYCDKHVLKIPIEIAQILSKIHHILKTKIDYEKIYANSKVVKESLGPYLWSLSSLDNYIWTCELGLALINEYKYRFGKSTHKTEVVLKYLLENSPPIEKKGITLFIMTNKFDMFQYISSNPVKNSRYNYAEIKCANDKWTKRTKPKWFDLLKNKIIDEKKKLKSEIEHRVKDQLPKLAKKNSWTVYRFHSFLRVSYDCLFQGKWDIKAKFMNKYNPSEPLINQLTYPQLYFVNQITKSIVDTDKLNKLNIESLKYRNKQKYAGLIDKKEWINLNPYKPTKTIFK
jgi:hypothetical protein